jgi:hypothetical protein
MSRVWYDPRTWFSRGQAENGLNKATTAALQSALTNYINATKNMNANAIRAALNNKKIGLAESYKNRIANGVANAVVKARKANVMMKAANLGAIPETAAAAAVQTAATAVKNLNAINWQNASGPNGTHLRVHKNKNGKWQFHPNNSNFATKGGWTISNNGISLMKAAPAMTNVLTNLTTVGVNGKNVKYGKNKNGKWQFNKNTPNNIRSAWRINNSGSLVKITAAATQSPATQRPANQRQAPTTGNMFKQANNAANKAKKNALQQGKTEQNANKKAAEAAAQTAVANAPPSANANAVRQAAKAATLAAGATPAAANNASKMVTQKLNEPIEEIQGGPRNNAYGNNKRTNKSRAMNTSALVFQLGSRSMNARSPAYIAEALARLKNNSSSANNKASLVEILVRARNTYKVPLVIPQVN